MFELFLDEKNRVTGCQNTTIKYSGGPTVDTLPGGNLADYLFVDGQFVYDPLPQPEPPTPEPTADEILNILLGVSE